MVNEYIAELSYALSNNHAAVMVGAGFSKNAQKITTNSKSFLSWNELSDEFLRKVNIAPEDCKYLSTLRIAQEVEDVFGRPTLDRIIQDALPDLEYIPGKFHVELLNLPWSDVFTTNYDTLLERATQQVVTRRYSQILNQQDLINSRGCPRIVKLHGSFPSTKPFIITEQDFRTYPRNFAPFVNTVQQALIENVFCLIGFSCDDPNFISWIGWIHDNLGKQNVQRMYMVSVSGLSIAKVRYLEDKNINVIDLTKLSPEKMTVEDRLKRFFDLLKSQIQRKDETNKWFDYYKTNPEKAKSLADYCDVYKKVCTTYPGWAFMLYKYRNRTGIMYSTMESLKYKNGIWAQADSKTKFNFSYWFTKFCNLSEQPLVAVYMEPMFDFISETKLSDEEWWDKEQEVYYNDICLELLRAFREHYDETQWTACLKLLDNRILNEKQKQFLYVEKLNWMFASFETEKFRKALDEWQISSADLYYPMIKASLLVRIGEFVKAQEILKENLFSLRSQLNKNPDDPYLSSLEVCCVVLYNTIERHDHYFAMDTEGESVISKSGIDWDQERDSRTAAIVKAKEPKLGRNTTIEFNLDTRASTGFGTDKRVLEVTSYWRFLERTGSCLRIGSFVNKGGQEEAFRYAGEYYPHWTLMQMLVSGETKLVDSLYGRKAMSTYSQERVDIEIDNLLLCLNNIIPYLVGHNAFFAKIDMYDCFANTLSVLLSRLCVKCSLSSRDKILDALLHLNSLGKLDKLSGLKELFKELLEGYSSDEQMERLEKLLQFPVPQDRMTNYIDPLYYIKIPSKKKKLDQQLYYKLISELRVQLDDSSSNVKNGSLERFVALAYTVELNDDDKAFVIEKLKEQNNTRSYYALKAIDEEHKSEYSAKFIQDTMTFIKDSVEKKTWSADIAIADIASTFEELDIYRNLEFRETLELISNLLQIMQDDEFDLMGAVRHYKKDLNLIIQAVLLANLDCIFQNSENAKVDKKDEFLELLTDLKTKVSAFTSMDIPLLLLFQKYIPDPEFENSFLSLLWNIPVNETNSLNVFLLRLRTHSQLLEGFMGELQTLADMLSDRYMEVPYEKLDHLSIVMRNLIEMRLLNGEKSAQIDLRLERLCDETKIVEEDDEQIARTKVRCRLHAACLAKTMYTQVPCFKGVLLWKEIVNSPDEFVELRKVSF